MATKRWVPSVAGKACLGELRQLPEAGVAGRTISGGINPLTQQALVLHQPGSVEVLTLLASDDPEQRAEGEAGIYDVFLHQGTLCPAAPLGLPFLAALAAGEPCDNRGQLIYAVGALVAACDRTSGLHRQVRQAALASAHWLERASQAASPDVRRVVELTLRAAHPARRDSALGQALTESLAQLAMAEEDRAAEAEQWIPTLAGPDCFSEIERIPLVRSRQRRREVRALLQPLLAATPDARRRARLAFFRATQPGRCVVDPTPVALPFVAALLASEQTPDRLQLTFVLLETLNRTMLHEFPTHPRVRTAFVRSSLWLQRAAATLPELPCLHDVLRAAERAALRPTPPRVRAFRKQLERLIEVVPLP